MIPIAVVVSKHGDPEEFGERCIEVLGDLGALPYDTPLYACTGYREVNMADIFRALQRMPGVPMMTSNQAHAFAELINTWTKL